MLTLEQFVKSWNSYFHHELGEEFFVKPDWGGKDFIITGMESTIYINFVMVNENIIQTYDTSEKGKLVWEHLAELFSSDIMIPVEKFDMSYNQVFKSNQGGIGYEYIDGWEMLYDKYENQFHIYKVR